MAKILGQWHLIFDSKHVLITDIHWDKGIHILQYPPLLIDVLLFLDIF